MASLSKSRVAEVPADPQTHSLVARHSFPGSSEQYPTPALLGDLVGRFVGGVVGGLVGDFVGDLVGEGVVGPDESTTHRPPDHEHPTKATQAARLPAWPQSVCNFRATLPLRARPRMETRRALSAINSSGVALPGTTASAAGWSVAGSS